MLLSRIVPTRAAALALAGLLLLTACEGSTTRKTHFMARGRAYLEQQNYEKARVEFRNALQITPNDVEARYLSALVAEQLGNLREAVASYQATVGINADFLPAQTRLGRLVLLYAGPQAAMAFLKPVMLKHPADPGLLSVRAAARARLNDVPGALEDAEQAYKLAADDENVVAVLAAVYRRADRQNDARALLERAVVALPKSVPLRLVLAEQYQKVGEPAKAEKTLKDLVAYQPKDASLRTELAHFYVRIDRLDEAESVLQEAIKALPRDESLKLALVDFLGRHRGVDRAEGELKSMIAADPGNVELATALGDLYEGARQPAKAEAQYQAVISRDSSSGQIIPAKDRLAALKLRQGDVAAGERLIGEVLAFNPRDNVALELRAGVELSRGDPPRAITDLRAVLRDQPDSVGTIRALSSAYVADDDLALAEDILRPAAQAYTGNLPLRLDFARLLDQRGKIDEAREVAEELVKARPDNAEFRESAIRIELRAGDASAAQASLAKLLSAHADLPAAHYLAGLAAEAQGNRSAAAGHYEDALRLAPAGAEPLEALTRLYAGQGKADIALQRLKQVTDSYPRDPLPRTLTGEILLAQQRFPEAERTFTETIPLGPQWLAAYRGLAEAQFAQGNAEEAFKTLKSAEQHTRPSAAATLALGALYERAGRFEDAIHAYDEVLKRFPRSDRAANNLANLLANTRSDQSSLERALTLAARFSDSGNPLYIDTLGWVRYKRGEIKLAEPLLDRAVSLDPNEPGILYHLAMVQLKSGEPGPARDNLEHALKSAQTFDGVNIARATLASLVTPAAR